MKTIKIELKKIVNVSYHLETPKVRNQILHKGTFCISVCFHKLLTFQETDPLPKCLKSRVFGAEEAKSGSFVINETIKVQHKKFHNSSSV